MPRYLSQCRIATCNNLQTIIFKPDSMDANPPTLNDVDRRWKHRAGWPSLCNLPIATAIAFPGRSDLNIEDKLGELWSRVDEILARYQIEVRRCRTAVRTQKRYFRELPREDLRIFVDCIYNPEQQKKNPDAWSWAVVEIHQAIRETVHDPHTDIGVELCDLEYENSIRFTDVPPTFTQIQNNWASGLNYRDQVLAEFEHRPRLWQVMTVVGLQASNQYVTENECAIWFDAIDTKDSSWKEIEQKLVSILPAGIRVEIWQADGGLLSVNEPNTDSPQASEVNESQQHSLPGASVGSENQMTSGTLGGYVRVEGPATDINGKPIVRTYAITNAHVVLGDMKLSELQEIRWDQSNKQQGPMIQSPSREDLAQIRNDRQNTIRGYEREVTEFQTKLTFFQEANDPEAIDRLNGRIRKFRSLIEDLENEGLKMDEKDHSMGYVEYLAFGNRDYDNPKFNQHLAMDIALIDVSQSLESPGDVCLREEVGGMFGSRTVWNTWEVDDLPGGNDTKILSICGRTSGMSTGILNGIEVIVDMQFEKEDGLENKVKKQYLTAYGIRSPTYRRPFSQKGDSGSFVFAKRHQMLDGHVNQLAPTRSIIDDKFVVVGMLFADSQSGGLGFFIPFDALVAEIESLTGGKVIWPTKHNDLVNVPKERVVGSD